MRAYVLPALALALIVSGAAEAQTPRDLRDLLRARAGNGEDQLARRGYRATRETSPSEDQDVVYWEKNGRCVAVTITAGRFTAIEEEAPQYCDDGGTASGSGDNYGASQADTRSQRREGYDDRQAGRIYDRGAALTFLCYGDGRNPDVRAGYGTDNRDRTGARDGSAEVRIEIWGSRGRILPGNGEWRDLENVRDTGGRITGRYAANGLTQSRVDIDRRTGRIHIDGAQPFRGACDLGETSGQRRRY